MPEIKNKGVEFEGRQGNPNDIAFKDKIREKQRLIKLEKLITLRALNIAKKHKKETISWSDQKDLKQKKLDRKEKKVRKKEAILKAKEAGTLIEKKGKRVLVQVSEWEELQADARKVKKAKKGGKREEMSEDDDDEYREAQEKNDATGDDSLSLHSSCDDSNDSD